MKSYLSLIPISQRTRRKQNRLTLICIVLAVFLVTTCFSIVDIWAEGEEKSTIRRHGNYHIILNGISQQEAEQIAGEEQVAAAAWCRTAGQEEDKGYRINGKRIVLYGAEPSYINDIRNYETEGAYPENDKELMLSRDAKEKLGIHTGDSITIHTNTGGFDYTVSGFCGDDTQYNADIDGVCGYMTVNGLENICAAGNEEGSPVYYVQFAEETGLKEAIADVKARYGLSGEQARENTFVLALSGESSNKSMNEMYYLAAAVFLMILIAGVLMISSCMNSNVSQRTKFFGMMRCIGASKKQVMHFVRLEALNWCKTAVPIGLGLSIAVTWILCIVLKNLVGGEFSEFAFRLSPTAIVCGVLVGVVTVLLAAYAPARRAAAISPVAAVTGSGDSGKKLSHAANTRIFKVETALGVYHAASAKKNLILMCLSFAFMVILFFVFFGIIDIVKKVIPSESDFNPEISIVAADNTNSIAKSLKDEINRLPGVKAAFGNRMVYDVPALINGSEGSVDLISYDEYMLGLSKKSVAGGDISKITGNTNYAMTIFAMDSRLKVGDKIKIGDTELEIACVLSEGIGTENRPAVVCTEETFLRITGIENYLLLNVQFTKKITEKTVETIRTLADENEFADRRQDNATAYSSYWVLRLAAYGFLAIVSLITVFNIMNSISMSVSAKMKQYGAMRAVGMSTGQMTKMIAAEAVTYALGGLFIGSLAGICLHRFIIVKVLISHFGGVWKFPLQPLLIVIGIVAASCFLAINAPAKRMRDMAVAETINEL